MVLCLCYGFLPKNAPLFPSLLETVTNTSETDRANVGIFLPQTPTVDKTLGGGEEWVAGAERQNFLKWLIGLFKNGGRFSSHLLWAFQDWDLRHGV